MGQFVGIASTEKEDGTKGLAAIFKGYAIHIAIEDEQTLMKASSRYQPHHLNNSAAVSKAECWRAINAWARVEGEIKSGEKSYDDLPEMRAYAHLWRYNVR